MARTATSTPARSPLRRILRIGCLSLLAIVALLGAGLVYVINPFGPQATVPAVAPLTVTPAAAPPAPAPLALVNGLLLDGTGAEPIPAGAVLIRDGRIAAVGPRDAVTIPPDARVIDVQGATILPGLINAHVHYAYDVARLKAWAQAGVTTVRELGILAASESSGTRYRLRDNSRSDPQLARIVAASFIFTAPGGYPNGYGSLPVTSPEDARSQALAALDEGAEIVKLALADYRFPAERWPLLPLAEAQALVQVAHERGVPATVHIHQTSLVPMALDAGVDEIAHIPATEPIPDAVIRRAVEAGVRWTPTLEMYTVFGKTVLGRVPGLDPEYAVARVAMENLRRIVAAGGEIALGTDYGGTPGTFQDGLPMRELELMQEAGMTPTQILVAATSNAARACNMADELGTLAPGTLADILVVTGNPLDDLHHLQDVRLVIKGGTIIREEAR